MNSRINVCEGAVRSGKSFICLFRFIKELKDGPEGAYVICGKSERTVLQNVIEPLNTICNGMIRYKHGMNCFTLFNKKVYVIGANDERAESKIRGATFAGALVDEISIIPESFFSMLLSRLSVEGAKLFGTTNPDSPYHWLKANFLDRADELDISIHKFLIEDNPALPKSYVESLKKEYKGLWYKRFIEGLWVLAEGAIYDFFDRKVYVREKAPTYAKYWILGIDYGTTNPFAAVLVGVNDDHHPTIWIEKDYYWDSKEKGYQKTDSDYANDIRREFSDYSPRMIYLDPSAASFQVELRRAKMPVKQANNDVVDGIRFVSSLFTNGDLVILQQAQSLLKEIEGYVWDEKASRRGEDEPLKVRDHACDAMRYALYTHFGNRHSLKETQSERKIPTHMHWGAQTAGWQSSNMF